MTAPCPACHRPLYAAPSDLVAELRAETRALGIPILTSDRVREDGAARLLNRSPETLRTWRKTDQRLPFGRDGAGRITYRLADLAAFLSGEIR